MRKSYEWRGRVGGPVERRVDEWTSGRTSARAGGRTSGRVGVRVDVADVRVGEGRLSVQ